MTKVSLVTTVRNEAHTIEELIDAIGAQTRAPDEWIVVDGESTDGTRERLRGRGVERVLVEPGNIARGRNRAIAAASGRLIVVTDAGCRPAPGWLERMVAPIESGRADVTAGITRPRLRSPFDAAQWVLQDQFFSPRARWRPPTASSRSLAFRRSVWVDRGYPEWLDFGEDRWMVDEWRRRGRRMEFVGDPEASVEWFLPRTAVDSIRQHYRYMTGDGRGGLRPVRNLLRAGFYGVNAALSLGAGTWGTAAAAFLWGAYLAATLAARTPSTTTGRPASFRARCMLWAVPLLLGMDAAKIAGYARGALDGLGPAARAEVSGRVSEPGHGARSA